MSGPSTPARAATLVVLLAILGWLVATAPSGPGWDAASAHAVLAAHLDRAASAPLYDTLAGLFALLPLGEIGTRLSLLGALIGVATCAGVVAAVRALSPRDALAGIVGAVLLVLAPPFRSAIASADPSALAACGTVWAIAACAAGGRSTRWALVALVAVVGVIGSAPWLGVLLALLVAGWLPRRRDLAIGVIAIGVAIIVLWFATSGRLPGFDLDLAALVAASGRGAAAIVIGAGLLGAAFAALTGLGGARWLVAAITVVFAHALAIDHAPAALLAVLAIGASLIPCAVVRVANPATRRDLVALASGVPLVAMALVTGPALTADDPGAAPAHLATDLWSAQAPGPGVFVATRATVWAALAYDQGVAGARPDFILVAPLPATTADGIVADALRRSSLAASDAPVFGRLDPTRTIARGRSFELRATPTDAPQPPPAPAAYASATGQRESVLLAVARASFEAEHGRLDAAARAAGLTERFRAADLAVLATARMSPARPPLFALVPALEPTGPWLLALFGDDLAWVAGLPPPDAVPESHSRQLHAAWRQLLGGQIAPDDPAITTLGPAAIAATEKLVAAVPVASPKK